jgi:hypothetical protein
VEGKLISTTVFELGPAFAGCAMKAHAKGGKIVFLTKDETTD